MGSILISLTTFLAYYHGFKLLFLNVHQDTYIKFKLYLQIKSNLIFLQFEYVYIISDIIKDNPYYSKQYESTFKKSIENPEEFWDKIGQLVTWTRPWDKVLDNSNPPFTKW